MKNLEALLGDICYEVTGVRMPVYPEEQEKTDFQLHCESAANLVHREETFLRSEFKERFNLLQRNVLITPSASHIIMSNIIQGFAAQQFGEIPEKQKQIILHFLDTGINSIGIVSYRMENGKKLNKQRFRSNKDLVVLACNLLSGYPGPLSQQVKDSMANEQTPFFHDGDITVEFRTRVKSLVLQEILGSDEMVQVIKKLSSCPSHRTVDQFSSTVFEMYADAYENKYDEFRRSVEDILPDTIGNYFDD